MCTAGPSEPVAVILAGGASRRMRADKRFARLGGREALERVLDGAAAGFDRLVVAGGGDGACERALRGYGWTPAPDRRAAVRAWRKDGRGAWTVPDRRPGAGPLAGLEAALPLAAGATAWVLACDYPLLRPSVGRRLLSALAGCGADAVVPVVGGRRQPLCAAYGPAAAAAAAACLDGGVRAVHAFLDRLRVEELPEARLRDLGDPERLFLNLNHPGDLATARRLLSAGAERDPRVREGGGPPGRPVTRPTAPPAR